MNITFLDKLGGVGVVVTAMACPACWPLFAAAGSALGLGILAPWEGIMMNYVFPPLVVLSMAGSYFSFRFHRKWLPLACGVLSGLLILFGFYAGWYLTLMYIGIFGLLASAVLSYFANRKQAQLCQK